MMIAKRKYSPLYILFAWFSTLRNFFFIGLYLFIFNQSTGGFMMTVRWAFFILLPIMLIWSIVNWFVEKYEVNEKGFVLYRGVWNKREQTIPLNRVQNIHSKRNIFHRLCKLTVLTLETAGSGDNDTIRFPVIAEEEAESIKQYVQQYKAGDMAQADEKEGEQVADPLAEREEDKRQIHYVPTKKELLIASFTSFNFLIIVPILFIVLQFLSQFFEVDDYIVNFFGSAASSWLLITLFILLLLSLSTVIGIVWTYLTYGNYELSSDEEMIYIRKGIWEESRLTIQKQRVQGLRFDQSFLKRLLRMTEVKLLMIQDDDADVNTLYPFLPAKRAEEIIEEILPAYEVQEEENHLPIRALYVRLLTTFIFSLVISIPLWIWQPAIFGYDWISLWIGPILFVLISFYRFIAFKQTAYTIHGSFIQWKLGGFGRSRFLTDRKKVIEIEVTKGPLQRLFHLCSVQVVNRGKPVEEHDLADLDLSEMEPFISWYYEREAEVVRYDDSYRPETSLEE